MNCLVNLSVSFRVQDAEANVSNALSACGNRPTGLALGVELYNRYAKALSLKLLAYRELMMSLPRRPLSI